MRGWGPTQGGLTQQPLLKGTLLVFPELLLQLHSVLILPLAVAGGHRVVTLTETAQLLP